MILKNAKLLLRGWIKMSKKHNFALFKIASTQERIAFRIDDKRIIEVKETSIGVSNRKCTQIKYVNKWSLPLLNEVSNLDQPGYIKVEENFEKVLEELGIKEGETA